MSHRPAIRRGPADLARVLDERDAARAECDAREDPARRILTRVDLALTPYLVFAGRLHRAESIETRRDPTRQYYALVRAAPIGADGAPAGPAIVVRVYAGDTLARFATLASALSAASLPIVEYLEDRRRIPLPIVDWGE